MQATQARSRQAARYDKVAKHLGFIVYVNEV